jgi:hypothetical protein
MERGTGPDKRQPDSERLWQGNQEKDDGSSAEKNRKWNHVLSQGQNEPRPGPPQRLRAGNMRASRPLGAWRQHSMAGRRWGERRGGGRGAGGGSRSRKGTRVLSPTPLTSSRTPQPLMAGTGWDWLGSGGQDPIWLGCCDCAALLRLSDERPPSTPWTKLGRCPERGR